MIWNPSAAAGSGGTYTVYSALITQAGGAAPSETILFDSITGGVWTRLLAGIYQFTKVGAFAVNKTWHVVEQNPDLTTFIDGALIECRRINNNVVEIRTYVFNLAANTLTLTDSVLLNTPIEIRIYP